MMSPNIEIWGAGFNTSPSLDWTLCLLLTKSVNFLHSLQTTHLQAVKRIFRYMKNTIDQGLVFHYAHHLTIKAYSDSDLTSDPDDRRSTTGSCMFFWPNLLACTVKK